MSLLTDCLDQDRFPSVEELAQLYVKYGVLPRRNLFVAAHPDEVQEDWEHTSYHLCACPVGVLQIDHRGPPPLNRADDFNVRYGYEATALFHTIRGLAGKGRHERWWDWVGGLIQGFDQPFVVRPETMTGDRLAGYECGLALYQHFLDLRVQL